MATSTLTWPVIAFVIASLGLATYESASEILQGREIGEIKRRLGRLLATNLELRKILQRHDTGAFLAADAVQQLEQIELGSLPLNAPVRPYLVFYQLIANRFGRIEDALNELETCIQHNLALQEKAETILFDRLEVLLGKGFGETAADFVALEELIISVRDIVHSVDAKLEAAAEANKVLRGPLHEIQRRLRTSPQLTLSLHAYDPARRTTGRFHHSYERTDLYGRVPALELLRQFLKPDIDGDVDLRWWVWTGPGGMGKSRLAQQICIEARHKGYRAGFLRDNFQAWTEWEVVRPTLVVVDYVASRADLVRTAIVSLSRNADNLHAPVRFLLLERSADRDADLWWSQFHAGDGDDRIHLSHTAYQRLSNPYPLGRVDDDALWALMQEIFTEYKIAPPPRKETLAALREIDDLGRPLFAALAADAIGQHRGNLNELRKWDAAALADFILDVEFSHRWQKAGVDEPHLNLLTLLTVLGRQPQAFVEEILRSASQGLLPRDIHESLYRVLTGFAGLESPEYLAGLEPDILGEFLVLKRLDGGLHVAQNRNLVKRSTEAIIQLAACVDPSATLIFCHRAMSDFGGIENKQIVSLVALQGILRSLRFDGDRGGIPQKFTLRQAALSLARGIVWNTVGQHEDAIIDFSKMIEIPDVPADQRVQALFNRGVAYGQLKKMDKAIADFTAVIEMPDAPAHRWAQAVVNRAVLYGQSEKVDQAIADYTTVIEMPHSPAELRATAMFNRGFEHGQIKKVDQAIADYTAVIEMPGVPDDQREMALVNRAVIYRQLEKVNQAIADYTAVIDMPHASPDQRAMALFNRAVMYGQSENEDQAIADFSAVIETPANPADQRAQALLNRGLKYVLLEKLDQSIADLTAVIEMPGASPDQRATALASRGVTYSHLKRMDQAIADYTAVVEMPDSSPDQRAMALISRGASYAQIGNVDHAMADFKAAIEMPNASAARTAKIIQVLWPFVDTTAIDDL